MALTLHENYDFDVFVQAEFLKLYRMTFSCILTVLTFCRSATGIGLEKLGADPYPFGVDPAWHGSRTELPFLNSLKMKMSILLGVVQMNVGIILSFLNAKFYRSSLDIW